MGEHTNFLNMFSLYSPPEEAQAVLSQAAIRHADISPADRRVEVTVESPSYLPARVLQSAQQEIEKLYDLKSLVLHGCYPVSELPKMEAEELRDLFVAHDSMAHSRILFKFKTHVFALLD